MSLFAAINASCHEAIAIVALGAGDAFMVGHHIMKAVIWDWNGTLVNDASMQWEVFNLVLSQHGGRTLTFPEYQETYRHPVQDMYLDAGVDLVKHSFEEIAVRWHELYSYHSQSVGLHDDAMSVLEALAARGLRQTVLSALPQATLVSAVRRFGLESHFEDVRGLENSLGTSKLDEGIRLVAGLGLKRSELVVIGDSTHDAEVARTLECDCILVSRGLESSRRLSLHRYPVMPSLAAAYELIQSKLAG